MNESVDRGLPFAGLPAGGPGHSTYTLTYHFYGLGLKYSSLGMAAAASWPFMVGITTILIVMTATGAVTIAPMIIFAFLVQRYLIRCFTLEQSRDSADVLNVEHQVFRLGLRQVPCAFAPRKTVTNGG